MDVDALLADPPPLHTDGAGLPTSYSLSDAALRLLDRRLAPGMRTLETGNGISTLLFAMRRAEHTCVTPDAGSVDRTREWCSRAGVALDGVRFEIGESQALLPRLAPDPLDLVLIDGGHGFPVPFVDWLYTAPRLRAGGLLIVDDTQLWTGHVLRGFLLEEPGWELVEDLAPRTSVFRRSEQAPVVREWVHQPYVLRREPFVPLRVRAVRAARMVARGDLRRAVRRARELLEGR